MSDMKDADLAFGNAVRTASELLFLEVRANVRDGVYSEEEGTRIIMGAATFLVMLGDALGEEGKKIDNPFLDLH